MKFYSGVFTALVTPFKSGFVDLDSLKKLVEWQINSGVAGLVLCATTGEGMSLSDEEYFDILSMAKKVNASRVKLIVGTGLNDTRKTIDKIKKISMYADCVLVCAPYYNKPMQNGVYLHFKAIFEETGFPVMVYDVPTRCSVGIADDTMLRIMELDNIVAVKDATGSLIRPIVLKNDTISILSGDDVTSLAYYIYGGDGAVSVTSNVFPRECVALYDSFKRNDIVSSMKINQDIFYFNKDIFLETNPIPIKYALSLLKDYIVPEYRLPLTHPTDFTKNLVTDSFKKLIKKVQ